jgi:hypothetical protein
MEQIFKVTIRDLEYENPSDDRVEGPVLEDVITDGLEDAYGSAPTVVVEEQP